MDPGDGSMDGWSWSLQGRVTNTETITQQINYAAVNRGLSYESEGTNRVPVNWATVAERDAVAGQAGTTNYSARRPDCLVARRTCSPVTATTPRPMLHSTSRVATSSSPCCAPAEPFETTACW